MSAGAGEPAPEGALCENCSSSQNVRIYEDDLGFVQLCDKCEAEASQ